MQSIVYFLVDGAEIKVGFTTDFARRLAEYRRTRPDIQIIGTIPGDLAKEKSIQRAMEAHVLHGEWFRDSPEARAAVDLVLLQSHEPPEEFDYDWFGRIVREVFADCDPGVSLHETTGAELRSCYRYASGRVRPPHSVLRSLLRSEYGWRVLQLLMRDCSSPWWLEMCRAVEVPASEAASFISEEMFG